jgi:CheY-like chemotaxis protein
MSTRTAGFVGRHIVVADEDRTVVGLVVETLLNEGHAVFHAYDGLSANELALGLKNCDLVISNTRVGGKDGIDLIEELRAGAGPSQAPLEPSRPCSRTSASNQGLARQDRRFPTARRCYYLPYWNDPITLPPRHRGPDCCCRPGCVLSSHWGTGADLFRTRSTRAFRQRQGQGR